MLYITTYSNPDLDGLACVVAYTDFLKMNKKKVTPIVFGQLDLETDYVLNQTKLKRPDEITISSKDKIILVDASKAVSLPTGIRPEQVIEIIDHRKMTDAAHFSDAKLQIEMVGAAATLITEKYRQSQIRPSPNMAVLLLGAIISNTLDFRARVTTDRDRVAADWLKTHVTIPNNLVKNMFAAKSDVSGSKLQERLSSDRLVARNNGKLISILQLEILDAQRVVYKRTEEICDTLCKLEAKEQTDLSFASFLDLSDEATIFVTPDHKIQSILESIFSVKFINNSAILERYIMRKEIGPILAEYFSHE